MSLRPFSFAVLALNALVLCSCQKNVSDFVPAPTGIDSATLLKTITSVHYDDQNQFMYLFRVAYDYSSLPQKIVLTARDSTPYQIDNFIETYQYDNSNRLSVFTSTYKYEVSRIDFQYNSNGEVAKATVAYPNGSIIENTFKYQTINGKKVVTLYDTANVNDGGSERPRIATYTFDDSSRIVKYQSVTTRLNTDRRYWYTDTVVALVEYNSQGEASKGIDYYSYFSGGIGYPGPQFSNTDSVLYTHETRGTEIYNTTMLLFRNMYWFSLSEYTRLAFSEAGRPSFGNLELIPALYAWKHPVKQVQDWTTYSGWPPYSNGVFQNTFDVNGLLIHAVHPPLFANKYNGKSIFDYTYTKIKQ